MKIRNILLCALLSLLGYSVAAQNVSGVVRDASNGEPLIGASVYWLGTNVGVGTELDGSYKLHQVKGYNQLVAAYVGYHSDTIKVEAGVTAVDFVLKSATEIDEVVVEGGLGNYIKHDGLLKGETISFAGLCKMACCSLAESFENSASVTVGYSDAISGARQIKMLGLTGTYTQILDENRPIMRGLSAPYGLNYTPGMWLNSIQVSKGVASVTAGHEAITGQINMEHRKPTDEERLFVNLYFDSELRPEINLSSAIPVTADKRLSTVILAHGSMDTKSHDMNKDGFRDLPETRQINIANKWLYQGKNGEQLRWGWKYVDENRLSGEMDYRKSMRDEMTESLSVYGSHMDNKGANAYVKFGMPVGKSVYDEAEGEELRSNIAFVADYNYFKEDAYFGLNTYDGHDSAWWLNFMYAHYFSARSSMIMGASASISNSSEFIFNDVRLPMADGSKESWNSLTHNQMYYIEPGVYAEYTYNVPEKLSLVLGVRGDWMGAENRSGWQGYKDDEIYRSVASPAPMYLSAASYTPKEYFAVTPRSHIRWNVTPSTVVRASAGLGYRRASIFTDNIWMMATGRKIITKNLDNDIEQALTAGGSITQTLKLGGYSDATLSVDYFRTQLYNTVLADQELGAAMGTPADEIWIYNSGDKSFSDTYQVDFQWTPVKGLDLFATYRYTNAKVTVERDGISHLIERPLTSRYKTLLNVQYATAYRRWVFDATAQYNGPMRRPSLDGDLTRSELSPAYPMFYAQVSHKIRDWEIYVGCENIANYIQKDPILNVEDPFTPAFNSSSVWGPLMGRKFYIGLRFNLY